MAGRGDIQEKQDILFASCAEPSEARLRAADDSTISLFVSSVSKEIEDAGDLQMLACSSELANGVSFSFFWRASRSCYHRFSFWLL